MIDKKQFEPIIIIVLTIMLFLLAFLVLKSMVVPIFYGLILGYIFFPFKKFLSKKIKNNNLSALIVFAIVTILIISLFLIVAITMLNETTKFYSSFKKIDLTAFISSILPKSLNSQLSDTIIGSANSFAATMISGLENEFKALFLNIPLLLVQFLIVFMIFFFTLREGEIALENLKSLSPFKKETTERIIRRFKEVTNSVLLGQILVGILQGIVCGIGYFIFGVPNILILTYITMIVSLIPITGHGLVWIPVVIYLFMIGRTNAGIGLLIYGLTVITFVENFSRPFFIAKKTEINTGIVIVGMIGGLMTMGFSGLIIGPLILAYVLFVLDIYKNEFAKKE